MDDSSIVISLNAYQKGMILSNLPQIQRIKNRTVESSPKVVERMLRKNTEKLSSDCCLAHLKEGQLHWKSPSETFGRKTTVRLLDY